MNIALLNFHKEEEDAVNKLQYQYINSDYTANISITDTKTLDFNISNDPYDLEIKDLDLNCVLSLLQIKITHLKNLIIKNIDSSKYNLSKLKAILSKIGDIEEIKTIDDLVDHSKLICFVNFKEKKAASDCLKIINSSNNYNEWFVNYHIERLEREKLHYQDVKEDCNDLLFKKVYIGFSENKETSLSQKQHNTNNHVNQAANDIKIVIDPSTEKNNGKKLIDFKGLQVYKKLLTLMNNNISSSSSAAVDDDHHKTNFVVQSFHYHQTYCIIKLDTHKQAVDLIKLLDGNSIKIDNKLFTMFLHRAFVYNNNGYNSNSRKNSYSSRKNSNPGYPHGRRSSFFSQEDFTGRRFSETNDSYAYNSPNRSPSFSPGSRSPTFTDSSLANGYLTVSPDNTSPPMTMPAPPPPYYYNTQVPQLDGKRPAFNGVPSNSKFMYPRYVTMSVPMPFPMMMPYGNGNSPCSKPGSNSNMVFRGDVLPLTNKWVYPIPLSTQQHSNLYIQNLPLSWSDDDLVKFITSYLRDSEKIEDPMKELISYKVITHNFSRDKSEGFSKGYAFVSFTNPLVASKCMNDLNGFELPLEEYKKSKRNILDKTTKLNTADSEEEEEEDNNVNNCRIKINFAMKRGKSLLIAKNGPISYNKFFIECMEEQLGIRA